MIGNVFEYLANPSLGLYWPRPQNFVSAFVNINVCPPPVFGKMFTKSTGKNRVGPSPPTGSNAGNSIRKKDNEELQRKMLINNAIKGTEVPFHQGSLSTKRYQDTRSTYLSKLPSGVLLRSIKYYDHDDAVQKPPAVTDAQKKVLKKAYVLSKALPRQSNRQKWKDWSGQTLTPLTKKSLSIFIKGDLVFSGNASYIIGADVKEIDQHTSAVKGTQVSMF